MQAIILSRRDFREYDQIISVYTKEQGKLELLARGIKKITSKNSAHIEPFSVVDIDIAEGHEINHLTKVQPVEYFKNIRQDLQKSLAAQYVVSITDKFVQVGERDERIFEGLKTWHEFLNIPISQYPNILIIDCYIVELLYCLGFAMSEDPKMKRWKQKLEIMERGDWQVVAQLEYDEQLHKKIYEFLLYHTERKVPDWAKTCMIEPNLVVSMNDK